VYYAPGYEKQAKEFAAQFGLQTLNVKPQPATLPAKGNLTAVLVSPFG
jgi:hypothetical protein